MREGYRDRAIPESFVERGPTPDDVFCFPDVTSLRERIWTLINEIVTEDVKEEFRHNPPEYVVSDDLSSLNEIVFAVSCRDVEIKSLLAERLALEYHAFRAVHGTRTDDLASFYEHGLRCLPADEAEEKGSLYVRHARV